MNNRQRNHVKRYVDAIDDLLNKLDGGGNAKETVALDVEIMGDKFESFEVAITKAYDTIKAALDNFREDTQKL